MNRPELHDVLRRWRAVSDEEALKPFVLEAGGRKLRGTVEKTGSWFTYRNEKIGRIVLDAGRQKIVFRAGDKSPKGALLDLRTVRMVRVK